MIINSSIRPASSANAADHIDLRQTARALWAHKLSIGALMLGFMVVAALSLMMAAPLYSARASLLVQPSVAKPWDAGNPQLSANRAEQMLQTQVSVIQSRSVAERVVRALDLTANPVLGQAPGNAWLVRSRAFLQRLLGGSAPAAMPDDTAIAQAAFDHATQVLMNHTSVAITGESKVISVDVTLPDAQLAAIAANAIAHGYIEELADIQDTETVAATAWMSTRMNQLRTSLQGAESKLQDYRDAHGVVDGNGIDNQGLNDLTANSDGMIDARRQRFEAQSRYRQVQGIAPGDWQQLANLPAVLADPLIQQLQAQRANAAARLQQLAGRYGPEHPDYKAAQADQAAADVSLQQQVEQVVSGIKSDYERSLAVESALQASVDTSKAQLQTASRQAFELQQLQQDVLDSQALYDAFAQKLQEAQAGRGVAPLEVQMIDAAIATTHPSGPRMGTVLFSAGLLAWVLGCIGALLHAHASQRYVTAPDVLRGVDLPLLSVVPRLGARLVRSIAYCFEQDEHPGFCEAIRTLRVHLGTHGQDHAGRVLLVTSSLPGEGKSTVAVNLAFAMSGAERVLLVEADLRRPSLGSLLQLTQEHPGLTDLLGRRAVLSECLHHAGDLDVITAGSGAADPQVLLASPQFREFIAALEGRYDRVIIDSPACLSVSDSALLAHLADAVIYVIKAADTSADMVQKGLARLRRNAAPLFGVVLNQASLVPSPALRRSKIDTPQRELSMSKSDAVSRSGGLS